jgi:hypothetical protein
MRRITTMADSALLARLAAVAWHRVSRRPRRFEHAAARIVTETEAFTDSIPLPDWVGMVRGDDALFAARDEEELDTSWAVSIMAGTR